MEMESHFLRFKYLFKKRKVLRHQKYSKLDYFYKKQIHE